MFNLWNCCRLCLTPDDGTIRIRCEECPELRAKILECFNVTISEADKCSTKICQECASKVSNFSLFHSAVINSQKQMKWFMAIEDQVKAIKHENDDCVFVPNDEKANLPIIIDDNTEESDENKSELVPQQMKENTSLKTVSLNTAKKRITLSCLSAQATMKSSKNNTKKKKKKLSSEIYHMVTVPGSVLKKQQKYKFKRACVKIQLLTPAEIKYFTNPKQEDRRKYNRKEKKTSESLTIDKLKDQINLDVSSSETVQKIKLRSCKDINKDDLQNSEVLNREIDTLTSRRRKNKNINFPTATTPKTVKTVVSATVTSENKSSCTNNYLLHDLSKNLSNSTELNASEVSWSVRTNIKNTDRKTEFVTSKRSEQKANISNQERKISANYLSTNITENKQVTEKVNGNTDVSTKQLKSENEKDKITPSSNENLQFNINDEKDESNCPAVNNMILKEAETTKRKSSKDSNSKNAKKQIMNNATNSINLVVPSQAEANIAKITVETDRILHKIDKTIEIVPKIIPVSSGSSLETSQKSIASSLQKFMINQPNKIKKLRILKPNIKIVSKSKDADELTDTKNQDSSIKGIEQLAMNKTLTMPVNISQTKLYPNSVNKSITTQTGSPVFITTPSPTIILNSTKLMNNLPNTENNVKTFSGKNVDSLIGFKKVPICQGNALQRVKVLSVPELNFKADKNQQLYNTNKLIPIQISPKPNTPTQLITDRSHNNLLNTTQATQKVPISVPCANISLITKPQLTTNTLYTNPQYKINSTTVQPSITSPFSKNETIKISPTKNLLHAPYINITKTLNTSSNASYISNVSSIITSPTISVMARNRPITISKPYGVLGPSSISLTRSPTTTYQSYQIKPSISSDFVKKLSSVPNAATVTPVTPVPSLINIRNISGSSNINLPSTVPPAQTVYKISHNKVNTIIKPAVNTLSISCHNVISQPQATYSNPRLPTFNPKQTSTFNYKEISPAINKNINTTTINTTTTNKISTNLVNVVNAKANIVEEDHFVTTRIGVKILVNLENKSLLTIKLYNIGTNQPCDYRDLSDSQREAVRKSLTSINKSSLFKFQPYRLDESAKCLLEAIDLREFKKHFTN